MKRLIFLILVFLWLGCASTLLRFEQYSMVMNLPVAADSSVTLGNDDHFSGILWLNPILKAENVPTTQIKLIQNYGIYFLCAENFRRVWMIERGNDGLSANYKAIDVTPADETDAYTKIYLSRYGTLQKTYVKFKFNNGEVYLDRKGHFYEKYIE